MKKPPRIERTHQMMKPPCPESVRWQISLRGRFKKNVSAITLESMIQSWLDTGAEPPGVKISLHVWDHKRKGTLIVLDNSSRGDTLRELLRRALQDGRLRIAKVGKN